MDHLNEREAKLYSLCCEYGGKARHWRNKFIGLLPEAAKLELYKKLGFSSIFEFAAKLAGVSNDQVRLVLNLEQRFEDKPKLHRALVQGEVSLPKLARVVSIATAENESELISHLKVLPKAAIETMVRDMKAPSGLPGHDLRYLAPLCKNHHTLAHAVDARVQEKRKEVLRA